jgi:hypothetical protein
MTSLSDWANSRWVIFAIPATVVVLPLLLAGVLLAIRPAKKPPETVAVRPAPPTRTAPAQAPAEEAKPPAPAPPPTSTVAIAPPSQSSFVATTSPTHQAVDLPARSPAAAAPPPAVVDLISPLDVAASAVTGDWRKEGAALRCVGATQKNRAKLRLASPPSGSGYDFAVTFTASGARRVVTQVLSFRGKQFLFQMTANQCGIAAIHGRGPLNNETTRSKGISGGAKHTSVVQVRPGAVSAYLDGELVTSYSTDYSDLDAAKAWNLGPSSTKENVLGLAVECPVTVEAMTLTPLEAQAATAPTSAPARNPYGELAALISGPYSTESSAAATQPANRPQLTAPQVHAIAATSQPIVTDVATQLLQRLSSPTALSADEARGRDALFQAVQASLAPAAASPDPLLETRPAESSSAAIGRVDFDAEQTRLALWRALIGRMSELYPKAAAQAGVIKLQLEGKVRPAALLATNTQAQPLVNVTLAVELVHAMTAPAPTAVQYYYIARWGPNQKIYFPATVIPNVPSRELFAADEPSPLNGLAGLVEAHVQLWSDGVAQPNEVTNFAANAPGIARVELERAYRIVDDALRTPPATTRPAIAPSPLRPANVPPRPGAGLVPGAISPVRTDLADNDANLMRARALAQHAHGLLPRCVIAGDDDFT